jgi:hypothetical protein
MCDYVDLAERKLLQLRMLVKMDKKIIGFLIFLIICLLILYINHARETKRGLRLKC